MKNKHARIGLWYLLFIILFFMYADIQRTDNGRVVTTSDKLLSPLVAYADEPKYLFEKKSPTTLQEEMVAFIKDVFGKDGEKALKVLACENKKMGSHAVNYNRNGSLDYGLWQINTVHGYGKSILFDWHSNTMIAYELYLKAGKKFTPWTCAYVINQKSFYMK